jgi:hypothetical protein
MINALEILVLSLPYGYTEMYSVDRYTQLEYLAAWFYNLSVFEVDKMTSCARYFEGIQIR